MHNRREFMRYAAMLTGSLGLAGTSQGLPEAIRRALAIEPAPGTTFLDAEHIVILMQENRSFDHCFGTLRGVRGFADPRAMTLADGHPVWAQSDRKGQRFGPFRLDLKGTKITWMGSLPHGWTDQVDAAHGGRHDGWLEAKRSGEGAYAAMPLTMGYYTREDLPFYYALADAFTVCDQNFCSSLTGTTPNRLYLWTGTCRDPRDPAAHARVLNSDTDYGVEAAWTTFPERLEALGIPWKTYQNEISLGSGLSGESDAWLSNFTDNPLEWFTQFKVRFSPSRRAFVARRLAEIPAELKDAEAKLAAGTGDKAKLEKHRGALVADLAAYKAEAAKYTTEAWERLPAREKSLHERAFASNAADPDSRTLAVHEYDDAGQRRRLEVPKGDTLLQFRRDVEGGKLPAVSWLVAPERFSDHPGSAWYGAWYLAEVMDILTKNPEVWRKTIFVLTYDENDGLFDHVPPFQAANPKDPSTGRVSAGLDVTPEFVTMEQEKKRKKAGDCRENSIGLGFRVPMVVASPWSRGGAVCSQVFDHTSVIQLIERVFAKRTGGKLREPNISAWRRAVCGDMTSIFRPATEDSGSALAFVSRDEFIEQIHKASFKGLPTGFRALSPEDLAAAKAGKAGVFPGQEPGTRPSCPLPYELEANAKATPGGGGLEVEFAAGSAVFGERAAGAGFLVQMVGAKGEAAPRHYTAAAGSSVTDRWRSDQFEGGLCHLRAHGPNGFFREWSAPAGSACEVRVRSIPAAGDSRVAVEVRNSASARGAVELVDHSYGGAPQRVEVAPGAVARLQVETAASGGWYDFTVAVQGGWSVRAAGRVETGAWSTSDPAMGRAGA